MAHDEEMEGDLPITLWVFTKAYVRKGQVTQIQHVESTCVWNGSKNLVFSVLANAPRIVDLITAGTRVVATLMRPGFTEPQVLLSGPVVERTGEGMTGLPTRTFEVEGDFDIFREIIGWPAPFNAITAQSSTYHTVTGPAETVLRAFVTANAPRQGVAVTVAASAGLGPTVTVRVRMHPLFDRLMPTMERSNLGVDVVQDPDDNFRRLITWVPTTHTRVLTEESGIILPGAEFGTRAPTYTRVVVGAGGAGTARVFKEYIDTVAEAKYGVSRSRFVDARDIEPTDPDILGLMQARADEALAEGAEVVSLKVQLTETKNFQYGVTFQLGDKVPIKLADEAVITERISEVQLTWTRDSGLEVNSKVGSYEESPDDRLYKMVWRSLATGRNLEVTQ